MSDYVNGQSTDLSDLNEMFDGYTRPASSGGNVNQSNRNLLTKYFTPSKPKEYFRILPTQKGKKPIEEAYFHVVEIAKGPNKKETATIFCLAKNGVPALDENGQQVLDSNGKPLYVPGHCPFCEKQKEILSRQDSSIFYKKKEEMTQEQLEILKSNTEIFKEATRFDARKFYIVRGIDKGSIKDGVKYWRFKHNFKNQGVFNKLLPAMQAHVENTQQRFDSVDAGCDFIINVIESRMPNGRPYNEVASILAGKCSKLHDDDAIVREWLSDTTTWRDVFKPKTAPNITPADYMELVLQNREPYWDDSDPKNKHWVFPGNPQLEELANTRSQDLGISSNRQTFASDIDYDEVVAYHKKNAPYSSPLQASATTTTYSAPSQPSTSTVSPTNNVSETVVSETAVSQPASVNNLGQSQPIQNKIIDAEAIDNIGSTDDLPF